ncbi:MAG TPA: ThiF family adenylyltransferase [Pseudolabrys sp.]
MRVTLILPQSIATELAAAAREPLETGGVLLARAVDDGAGGLKVLARSMHWVAENNYITRSEVELRVASEVYIRSLAEAECNAEFGIWVHTHPNGFSPQPSPMDEVVDRQIAEVFRIRTGSDYYGSLIVSSVEGGFNFTGRIETQDHRWRVERVLTVGERLQLRHEFNALVPQSAGHFDRNIRAFGPAMQQTISDLTVAVVGCGGTGSAVAEQLVRLGVRKLILFDADEVSASNVTRLYGSTPADVSRQKVDVVRDHLRRIAPDMDCRTVQGMITNRDVALRLLPADVVFGCSDDNAGRIVLSRLSTYFIMPVIDCGVLLASSADGQLTDINGRITTMIPGAACMICRDRVDLARARTEMLTTDERVRLEDEGYAPALGRVEPAVVTFTSAVASFAVMELLERFIGFGPEPRPTEMLIRFHDREISTNVASPRGTHFCNPSQRKLGLGMTEPFLEQVWP